MNMERILLTDYKNAKSLSLYKLFSHQTGCVATYLNDFFNEDGMDLDYFLEILERFEENDSEREDFEDVTWTR